MISNISWVTVKDNETIIPRQNRKEWKNLATTCEKTDYYKRSCSEKSWKKSVL